MTRGREGSRGLQDGDGAVGGYRGLSAEPLVVVTGASDLRRDVDDRDGEQQTDWRGIWVAEAAGLRPDPLWGCLGVLEGGGAASGVVSPRRPGGWGAALEARSGLFRHHVHRGPVPTAPTRAGGGTEAEVPRAMLVGVRCCPEAKRGQDEKVLLLSD